MKYNSRAFLNENKGIAAIEITINTSSEYIESYVVISDCNKNITLDLSSYSKERFNSNMNKLNKLISELTVLKTKLKKIGVSTDFTEKDF
tara:strand:+ start:201 stop:470 length:270 start_codon:yes stop_codon:yes gene_type:complete